MDEWLPQAKATLQKACYAKFTQDERAKKFLLGTGNTSIAEVKYGE